MILEISSAEEHIPTAPIPVSVVILTQPPQGSLVLSFLSVMTLIMVIPIVNILKTNEELCKLDDSWSHVATFESASGGHAIFWSCIGLGYPPHFTRMFLIFKSCVPILGWGVPPVW